MYKGFHIHAMKPMNFFAIFSMVSKFEKFFSPGIIFFLKKKKNVIKINMTPKLIYFLGKGKTSI